MIGPIGFLPVMTVTRAKAGNGLQKAILTHVHFASHSALSTASNLTY